MDNLVTMHPLQCFVNVFLILKCLSQKKVKCLRISLLFIHYKSDFHHVKFFCHRHNLFHATDNCLEMYTK